MTDERLCTVCGRGRYEDPRHGTCNHQTGGAPVFCSCHRFSPPEAAPQPDERLCGVCGHEESAHVGDDPSGQVCIECDGNGEHELMLHAFDPSSLSRPEAAPSTDEGEARPVAFDFIASAIGKFAHGYWQWRNTGEPYRPLDDLQEEMVAAIRAPLEESRQRLTDAFCEVWLREVGRAEAAEERIRELEAEQQRLNEVVDRLAWMEARSNSRNERLGFENGWVKAENDRLREALENVRRVMHLPRAEDAANRAVDIATAALRPPSSTEGTE